MNAIVTTPADATALTPPAIVPGPARTNPGDFDLLIALLQGMLVTPLPQAGARPTTAGPGGEGVVLADEDRGESSPTLGDTPPAVADAPADPGASSALLVALMTGQRGRLETPAPSAPSTPDGAGTSATPMDTARPGLVVAEPAFVATRAAASSDALDAFTIAPSRPTSAPTTALGPTITLAPTTVPGATVPEPMAAVAPAPTAAPAPPAAPGQTATLGPPAAPGSTTAQAPSADPSQAPAPQAALAETSARVTTAPSEAEMSATALAPALEGRVAPASHQPRDATPLVPRRDPERTADDEGARGIQEASAPDRARARATSAAPDVDFVRAAVRTTAHDRTHDDTVSSFTRGDIATAATAPLASRSVMPEGEPVRTEPTRHPVEQVAARLGELRQGRQEISLRLDPPDLGGVRIEARLEGTRLEVQIRTEHASTRELLAEALPRLRESLSQQGFVPEQVSVQLGLDGSGRQQARDGAPTFTPPSGGGAVPRPPAVRATAQAVPASDGLDVWA